MTCTDNEDFCAVVPRYMKWPQRPLFLKEVCKVIIWGYVNQKKVMCQEGIRYKKGSPVLLTKALSKNTCTKYQSDSTKNYKKQHNLQI